MWTTSTVQCCASCEHWDGEREIISVDRARTHSAYVKGFCYKKGFQSLERNNASDGRYSPYYKNCAEMKWK